MTTPLVIPDALIEGTTGSYSFALVDGVGEPIDPGFLDTLTATYWDLDNHVIVNGRDHQNILNANGGSVQSVVGPPAVTVVMLEFTPDDTVILNEHRRTEQRVLTFEWSWDGGQRHNAHAVQFGINNLEFVP
jgi:hypothetical protein